MFRSAIVAACCLTAIFTLSVHAQQPQPAQKPPVFRSTVDLVHLDVSVLDKDRHPIRGLTDKDFTITEDNKPQDIAVFTAVDVPENPPKPAAWSGRAPVDVQSNEGASDPEGRLFVVLIDDAMIPPHAPSIQTTREVAKKFIDKVTPADRVAIVFSMTGRNQNFTSDRAKLVQAIETMKQGYATHLLGWDTAKPAGSPVFQNMPKEIPGPAGDPDIPYRIASVQTLRMVAETLISAPQRRKALIYLSPGIDVDEASVAVPVKADQQVDNSRSDANRKLFQDTAALFLRMQQANVTIYPVDPCGAGGFQAYLMGIAGGVLKARDMEPNAITGDNNPYMPTSITSTFNWLNPGFAVPTTDQFASHVSTITMSFLESAAANTGGRAIINTNDFDTGLQQIFDENSSYYLLGYQQPPYQTPGSVHRISVKVNRPGVIIRTRSGYATADAPKKKNGNAEPLSALDKAIVNAVPDGSFPMRVALAPFALPGKKEPTVTIALGLTQPPVTARAIFAVDVQTNAYTDDGRPKFIGQRHTATVTLVPTKEQGVARYDLQLVRGPRSA
jgi:VWFA-related protein